MSDPATPRHEPDLAALSAYLDDELDADERQRLAGHLADCPLCSARLAKLRWLAAQLRSLPEARLGFDLAGVIEGRLAAAPRTPVEKGRRRWLGHWPLAVGAAASLAIGISMGSALVAGGAVSAPPMAALRVFDTLPPGSLCIGLDSCYAKGSLQ